MMGYCTIVGRGILDAPFETHLPTFRRVWEAAPYNGFVQISNVRVIVGQSWTANGPLLLGALCEFLFMRPEQTLL